MTKYFSDSSKYFLRAAGHERGAGGRVPAEHLRAGEREDVQLAQPDPHQQAQRGAQAAPAARAPHAAMQGRHGAAPLLFKVNVT